MSVLVGSANHGWMEWMHKNLWSLAKPEQAERGEEWLRSLRNCGEASLHTGSAAEQLLLNPEGPWDAGTLLGGLSRRLGGDGREGRHPYVIDIRHASPERIQYVARLFCLTLLVTPCATQWQGGTIVLWYLHLWISL